MLSLPDEELTPDAPLTLRNAWIFPIQNTVARRELLLAGALFSIPLLGWVLNMGHRMNMVHRFHRGLPMRPAWQGGGALLRHGLVGLLAFALYAGPGAVLVGIGAWTANGWLVALGGVLFCAGTYLIPCFMTAYCRAFDIREVLDLVCALRNLRSVGGEYPRAWCYVLLSGVLSLGGLLLLGVGIFWTTVWNWQVAAFCFCHVFRRTDSPDFRRGGAAG